MRSSRCRSKNAHDVLQPVTLPCAGLVQPIKLCDQPRKLGPARDARTMEVRVVEAIQRMSRIVDHVPKPHVVIWIRNEFPTNKTTATSSCRSPSSFFETSLGSSRQGVRSEYLRVHDRVAEDV